MIVLFHFLLRKHLDHVHLASLSLSLSIKVMMIHFYLLQSKRLDHVHLTSLRNLFILARYFYLYLYLSLCFIDSYSLLVLFNSILHLIFSFFFRNVAKDVEAVRRDPIYYKLIKIVLLFLKKYTQTN